MAAWTDVLSFPLACLQRGLRIDRKGRWITMPALLLLASVKAGCKACWYYLLVANSGNAFLLGGANTNSDLIDGAAVNLQRIAATPRSRQADSEMPAQSDLLSSSQPPTQITQTVFLWDCGWRKRALHAPWFALTACFTPPLAHVLCRRN